MSYIENLTGNTIEGGLQETLSLGAGNFKIRGFDLTNTGDYLVLSSGIALIDGLRVKSTGNLKLPIVDTFNKYILLRIRTYTEVVDGLTVRKAELSLIAQTSSNPVNNKDLYTNIIGTKDVLLDFVDSSGVVSGVVAYSLLDYDTGWINITLPATYTGSISYRIWNNVLYFRGMATRTSGNVTHGEIIGSIQRKVYGSELHAIAKGSIATPIGVTLKVNGELYISINAGTTSTSISLDGVAFKL